jgi:hypothetical protein
MSENRYDGYENTDNSIGEKKERDEREFVLEFGTNKFYLLPTIESNNTLFFYKFYIHKAFDPKTHWYHWVNCPRRMNYGAYCPICEEGNNLWNSSSESNKNFAKANLFAKTKYLINVVPFGTTEVKILKTDPRIVGFPPKVNYKTGDVEKFFVGKNLITFNLAIDQETYESTGKEAYNCPKIVGEEATYVVVNREKAGKYDNLTISIPQIESQRKVLENYNNYFDKRHDLKEYRKVIVKDLDADELARELEILLTIGVKVHKNVTTEPEPEPETIAEEPTRYEAPTTTPELELSEPTKTEDLPACFGKEYNETTYVCNGKCDLVESCKNALAEEIMKEDDK